MHQKEKKKKLSCILGFHYHCTGLDHVWKDRNEYQNGYASLKTVPCFFCLCVALAKHACFQENLPTSVPQLLKSKLFSVLSLTSIQRALNSISL